MESTEDSSNEVEMVSKEISKEERIENEKHELLNKVISGKIEHLKDRVAYILNNHNNARNSDIELAWLFWQNFESEILNSNNTITKDQMMGLTKISSIARVRAKIQNEYKLFQADPEVKKFRGTLEEEYKQEAVHDKPGNIGLYQVYIDETGKNQDYLSVGSLWLTKFGVENVTSILNFNKWIKENITFELHFTELSKTRLPLYKEFFKRFLSYYPQSCFKLIVVNNKGFSDKNAAITDLSFHLLYKGVIHENDSGRALLPRKLQVVFDQEEKGSDKLKIENIKERLNNSKLKGLYLGDFLASSSEESIFIQVTDLFTASVNRKLHSTSSTHFKDEFADFVFECLNFDFNKVDKNNDEIDNSNIFDLTIE